MRVISGKARSMPLKTIDSMATRPTTDRIKETLFNILNPYMTDCRFLDLFAGSGAIGIEALSRGASKAVFVEKASDAAAVIRENLTFTKLDKDAVLMQTDAVSAIKKLDGEEPYDFIFLDPPYRQGLEKAVLDALLETSLLKDDTWIIIEAALDDQTDYIDESKYEVLKLKKYKTNKHIFLGRVIEKQEKS